MAGGVGTCIGSISARGAEGGRAHYLYDFDEPIDWVEASLEGQACLDLGIHRLHRDLARHRRHRGSGRGGGGLVRHDFKFNTDARGVDELYAHAAQELGRVPLLEKGIGAVAGRADVLRGHPVAETRDEGNN